MKRIDSHQHFWQFDPSRHTWMSDEMERLKTDYLPANLSPLLRQIQFDGCIAVQAAQSIDETDWLLQLADENNFIAGVVGWVDLRSPNISETLAGYADRRKLVGVRHVVHDESDDYFMLQPAFQRGIAALKEFELTYDLLLFPKHIPVALKLVEKFPDQSFVVDHIAKPGIRSREISPWISDLKDLARHPNVFCKLSGMVTEAKWQDWTEKDFRVYLDMTTEAFGTSRVMIGSDWPVCTLSGDYSATMEIVMNFAGQFSTEICAGILGDNCLKFYKIFGT